MRLRTLRRRSLFYFWRTNVAVVLGVATAVAVLAGSLLVGESVRESLRRLALARLGRTSLAVESPRFFPEALMGSLRAQPAFAKSFSGMAPLLALPGSVAHQGSGRQALGVLVYGVDARFFAFQGVPEPEGLTGRAAVVSEALGAELQAKDGDGLVVKLTSAADIPGSTLFGRRDEPGQRLRVAARGVLTRDRSGDFALQPRQQDVRAVFVPLSTLQKALGLEGRVNTLLVSEAEGAPNPHGRGAAVLGKALGDVAALEDLGLRLRTLEGRNALALESASSLLDDRVVEAGVTLAREQGLEASPIFIYLANAIRVNGRDVPYSLVAALGDDHLRRLPGAPRLDGGSTEAPPLVLNEWAASDLGARPGDSVTLEYYSWREEGRLETRSSAFTLTAIVPLEGGAADRDLVPAYPGITESLHLSDWDPPFPVDLKRIRPKDEAYWDRWRTTPKAFVGLEVAHRLWGHRLGHVTSLRLTAPAGADLVAMRERFGDALRAALVAPAAPEARAIPGLVSLNRLRERGLLVSPVRETALQAATGATDFGEYFVYFSFFLVIAALLLAGLFFRLGLEQRLREVGLLRAVGFTPRGLLRQFLGEGLVLAVAGAALGMAGATLYAAAIVAGLRTVWVGAVGTRALVSTVTPLPLLAGALGGVLAAVLAIAWTLRGLLQRSPRALLAGALSDWAPPARPTRRFAPRALLAVALLLLAAAFRGVVAPATAFFGAGGLLLVAALLRLRASLGGRPTDPAAVRSVTRLGLRGASFRPGRSLLCIALVAAAAFVIVSVGAFRREGAADLRAHHSESGGFALFATSLQPLHNDPRTPEGRAALGLPKGALSGVVLHRFRMSAGEDGSCLNLFRPRRPTVIGATPEFVREGRFAFAATLAETAEERANPWLLLERDDPKGAIPVAADGNSQAYVLHRRLGDEMVLGDSSVRVRFVATLRPGLFQSELLTGERHFQKAFPLEQGYRFFLIDVPKEREAGVTEILESRLSDYGFDVSTTAGRLLAFHRVENTYIVTFQTLGALGLLLGTLGLGTVLLRNAFERRRELALLQAVGFARGDIRRMVLSENGLLLGLGLLVGSGAALVAIAPALAERGGGAPLITLLVLVLAVTVTGILVSWFAVAVIARLPLLASLRSE